MCIGHALCQIRIKNPMPAPAMVMMKNTRITGLLVTKVKYDVMVVITQVTNSVAAERIAEREEFAFPPPEDAASSTLGKDVIMPIN